jgi:hypothetical protein
LETVVKQIKHRQMMRGYGYIVAMTAFALLMMSTGASSAEDQVITLTCDGKVTAGSGRTEQVKIGMVVNLAEKTVAFGGHVVEISRVDAANVSFGGHFHSSWEGIETTISIDGNVDRVTGKLQATQFSLDHSLWFDLGCNPTNRLF